MKNKIFKKVCFTLIFSIIFYCSEFNINSAQAVTIGFRSRDGSLEGMFDFEENDLINDFMITRGELLGFMATFSRGGRVVEQWNLNTFRPADEFKWTLNRRQQNLISEPGSSLFVQTRNSQRGAVLAVRGDLNNLDTWRVIRNAQNLGQGVGVDVSLKSVSEPISTFSLLTFISLFLILKNKKH